MQTLADFLSIRDVESGQEHPNASEQRPKLRKMTSRHLMREVLTSPEYLESVYRRIRNDTLPAAVEIRMHDYAYGKPVEKTEVKDTTNRLEGMSLDQLEARAHLLHSRIRQLREEKKPSSEGSVH